MSYEPIITNRAQEKMKKWGVTKQELMAAFNSTQIEKGMAKNSTTGIYRYGNKEICATYLKDYKGQWKIISCWKRRHF